MNKKVLKYGGIGLVLLIVLLAVLKSTGVIGEGNEIKVSAEKTELSAERSGWSPKKPSRSSTEPAPKPGPGMAIVGRKA